MIPGSGQGDHRFRGRADNHGAFSWRVVA
jgi:hypothetical protein